MQWIRVGLLIISVAFVQASNTEKPTHGVSMQVTVRVVTARTACVFVSVQSEQPIQLRSAQWLHGDWLDDATVDCSALQQKYAFTAQIPTESAYQAVPVQITWQMGSDLFSTVYSGSAAPTAPAQRISPRAETPVDPDGLFIIRIGE